MWLISMAVWLFVFVVDWLGANVLPARVLPPNVEPLSGG
jgi:hypothetical protein